MANYGIRKRYKLIRDKPEAVEGKLDKGEFPLLSAARTVADRAEGARNRGSLR